jgi:hypothetical protein
MAFEIVGVLYCRSASSSAALRVDAGIGRLL